VASSLMLGGPAGSRLQLPRGTHGCEGHELKLPSWREGMERHANPFGRAGCGSRWCWEVSTRGYARSLEPLPEAVAGTGVSARAR